ncbi:MAG: hypothetical protein JNM50_05805 [Chromatiales bacterium]|jgi:hypothetical protein|nr:hypothetical protein [Chromatiales bacterium]
MTLFPLDHAEQYLGRAIANVERDGLTLRWPAFDGVTELTVEPVNEQTSDGLTISEIVTLTHRSPLLAVADDQTCAALNRLTTLSALTPGNPGEPTVLRARISIFSQEQRAARILYGSLLCQEAAVIGWRAAHLGRVIVTADPDSIPLRMTDQDPPYDQADFEVIKARSDRAQLFGNTGDRMYTVELPWDAGAMTRLVADPELRAAMATLGPYTNEDLDRMAGRTSLVTIKPGTHPLIGKGLRCSLEIPLPADQAQSAALVTELNQWELGEADLPPHLGAWCTGPRSLAYLSFVPTQLCVPGLPSHLADWAAARHVRVRELHIPHIGG